MVIVIFLPPYYFCKNNFYVAHISHSHRAFYGEQWALSMCILILASDRFKTKSTHRMAMLQHFERERGLVDEMCNMQFITWKNIHSQWKRDYNVKSCWNVDSAHCSLCVCLCECVFHHFALVIVEWVGVIWRLFFGWWLNKHSLG